MKCFFCQFELLDPNSTGILDCHNCYFKPRYVCSSPSSRTTNLPREVWFIHIRMDPYLVEWDLDLTPGQPITSIYAGPTYKEDQFVMKLENPLPYDMQEVIKLIDRLKNIKAFI